MNDPRAYPDRPYLAVSAAIIRDGQVLIVRRGRPPALGIYTLPGGAVEIGETVSEAVIREVLEETGLEIEPVALAGHNEVILRDASGHVERHFVILCFAANLIGGTEAASDEIAQMLWIDPEELDALRTTEGLGEIVQTALELLNE